MTVQIRDSIYYRDTSYSIVGVNGNNEGIFDPEQYGLEPEMFITACWRGYYCGYYVRNNQLFLEYIEVKDKNERYPPINDVNAEPSGHGSKLYNDINLVLKFSGVITIGSDFSNLMLYPVPEAFNIVIQLDFDDGRLTNCHDISRKMWKKRMQSQYFRPSNIAEWGWVRYFGILSTVDRLSNKITALFFQEDYTRDIPVLLDACFTMYEAVYEKYRKERNFFRTEMLYFSAIETYLCYVIVKEDQGKINKKALSQLVERYSEAVYSKWEALRQKEEEEQGYSSRYFHIPKVQWEFDEKLSAYQKNFYESQQSEDVFKLFHSFGLPNTTAARKENMEESLFPFLRDLSFSKMRRIDSQIRSNRAIKDP